MRLGVNRNSFGKKVVKVVVSGGPSSGKSSSIDRVKELVQKQYGDQWICYTVAEAESVMTTGRVSRDDLTGPRLKQWQRDMVECALTFESVFDNLAAREQTRHIIILCDGGALDAKVTTPVPMWPQILSEMRTSERQLMARYYLVLVLHTAPEDVPGQRCEIDMRYVDVWQEHPRAIEIDANSEDGIEEKVVAVWSQIEQLLHND